MGAAGLLVWSVALMREGRGVAAAAVYAVLINMKHLFLCLAPLYLIYLLSHDCRCALLPLQRRWLARDDPGTQLTDRWEQ